jgi:hypothetical protein
VTKMCEGEISPKKIKKKIKKNKKIKKENRE